MPPSPVCQKCGSSAAIVATRFVYERTPTIGSDYETTLREVQHDIDCPKCGLCTQVEQVVSE